MRISQSLIKYLLGYVTVGNFDDHDEPPEDVTEFADAAEQLRSFAEETGNMQWLHLAIGYLLSTPGVELREYNGGQYPFGEREMRELLEFLRQSWWPGEDIPDTGEAPGGGRQHLERRVGGSKGQRRRESRGSTGGGRADRGRGPLSEPGSGLFLYGRGHDHPRQMRR